MRFHVLAFVLLGLLCAGVAFGAPEATYDGGSQMVVLSRPIDLAEPALTRSFQWPNVQAPLIPIPTVTQASFQNESDQVVDAKKLAGGLNIFGLAQIGGNGSSASFTQECLGNEVFIVPEADIPFPPGPNTQRYTVSALRVGSILYKLNTADTSGLSFNASVDKYFLNLAQDVAKVPVTVDAQSPAPIVTPATPVPVLNCKNLDEVANQVASSSSSSSATPSTSPNSSPTASPSSSPTASPSSSPGSSPDRTISLAVDSSKTHAAVIFGKASNVVIAVGVIQTTQLSDNPQTTTFTAGDAASSYTASLPGKPELHVDFQASTFSNLPAGCVAVSASTAARPNASPNPDAERPAPRSTPWTFQFCPKFTQIFPTSLRSGYVQNLTYSVPFFVLFPTQDYLRNAYTNGATEQELDLSKTQFTFDPSTKQLSYITGPITVHDLRFRVTLVSKP